MRGSLPLISYLVFSKENREEGESMADVKVQDRQAKEDALTALLVAVGNCSSYEELMSLDINSSLEYSTQKVEELEAKNEQMITAKQAIETIRSITNADGSQMSVLESNYKLIRSLLEGGEAGNESQVLYLLSTTSELPDQDVNLQKEFTKRLSQQVSIKIEKVVKSLRLCQFTDKPWKAHDHNLDELLSLWKVASSLFVHHEHQHGKDPVLVFVEVFLSEFRYHFQGDLPTADPHKPEWVIGFCSRILDTHAELFKAIEPACSEGHSPEVLFFEVVVNTLSSRLYEPLQEDLYSDYQFSECIAAVTNFESQLSSFGVPPESGLAIKLITGRCIIRWLELERSALNLVLTNSREDKDAWQLSTPLSLLEYDDLKVAKCVLSFYSAVNSLIKKLCKARVSSLVISKFNVIIVKGLELLSGDVRELVLTGTTEVNFVKHIVSSNSMRYLQLCIGTWLLSPVLCDSVDYSDLTDLLALQQTKCLSEIATFCSLPVTKGSHTAVTENLGGVSGIQMDLRLIQCRMRTLKKYATDQSYSMIRDMTLQNIEGFITRKLFPVTESGCRVGLLSLLVEFADSVSGKCRTLSDMLTLLSLPAEQQSRIRSKPITAAVLQGLRLQSITVDLATDVLSETFDDQLNNAVPDEPNENSDLNDTDSEDWR
eukprot:TRINITY_DN7993_c0_g1_i1.p1 TRINITY_DN7993_c0_g1~~TRINITY_DN7993_c0_g1_i1.p1  ORF type:complete len:657 (+),score=118.81 TRINITY_DN7993_c0_g1_i1:1568-3538(+)